MPGKTSYDCDKEEDENPNFHEVPHIKTEPITSFLA